MKELILALKGDGKGLVWGRWSQNAIRTVWNCQKPAWNVREFYFGDLVGTPCVQL